MEPGLGQRLQDVEEDGRAIHARLIRGDDPIASSDFARLYLDRLLAWLSRQFPDVDDQVLGDVAIELILKLGRQPHLYDPDRGPLSKYLRVAAPEGPEPATST